MNDVHAGRPHILVVDDTPANLVAMRRLLARVDATLVEAGSGNAALAACLDHEFALILLDVQMPDMDGFEVATLLADDPRTRSTPVIFVTAAADDMNRMQGYRVGAVDYIGKPINEPILLSKVEVFLELHRARLELKALLAELHRRNEALEHEVAERKRAEEQVRHQASHDALTGLPNRALFMDRLEHALARARREVGALGLLYLDIDGFKPVNDTHGHGAGDLLLQEIAERLRLCVREVDTVARLGGDEFAVIVGDLGERGAALALGARIVEALRKPYALSGATLAEPVTVQVGASVGVAVFPEDAATCEALIRAADGAMYAAKRGGRNRVEVAG